MCWRGSSPRCGRRSRPRAGPSRSSSATRSWLRSASPPHTRTTPRARCARRFGCSAGSATLNHELAAAHGVELGLRIGVNTGEVLAATAPQAGRGDGDRRRRQRRRPAAAGRRARPDPRRRTHGAAVRGFVLEPAAPPRSARQARPRSARCSSRASVTSRLAACRACARRWSGATASSSCWKPAPPRGRGGARAPRHDLRRPGRRQEPARRGVHGPGRRPRSCAAAACRTATASRTGRWPRS